MYSCSDSDHFWCPIAHAIVKKDGWVVICDTVKSERLQADVEKLYKCLWWINGVCDKCGKTIDKNLLEGKQNG